MVKLLTRIHIAEMIKINSTLLLVLSFASVYAKTEKETKLVYPAKKVNTDSKEKKIYTETQKNDNGKTLRVEKYIMLKDLSYKKFYDKNIIYKDGHDKPFFSIEQIFPTTFYDDYQTLKTNLKNYNATGNVTSSIDIERDLKKGKIKAQFKVFFISKPKFKILESELSRSDLYSLKDKLQTLKKDCKKLEEFEKKYRKYKNHKDYKILKARLLKKVENTKRMFNQTSYEYSYNNETDINKCISQYFQEYHSQEYDWFIEIF